MNIHSIRVKDFIIVQWKDSFGLESQWMTLDEADDFCSKRMEITSIGIVFFVNKNYIGITSSFSNSFCTDQMIVNGGIVIPKSSILDWKKYKNL